MGMECTLSRKPRELMSEGSQTGRIAVHGTVSNHHEVEQERQDARSILVPGKGGKGIVHIADWEIRCEGKLTLRFQ